MVEAARKYDRVVQVGTQSRSRPNTHRFIDYVHSGKIGKVLMAKVWNTQKRRNIGHKKDEPVPAGINYDLWNGPIPVLPFNRNHYSGTVNWHWHYGCGDLGNDGVHWIDVARWVMKAGLPKHVTGAGRKLYFDDDQQTPDTQTVVFDYEDTVIQYEMRLWNPYKMNNGQNGVEVYGTEGKAVAGYFDGHPHVRLPHLRFQAPAGSAGTGRGGQARPGALRQLHRLYPDTRNAQLRRGGGAPVDIALPPGEHRGPDPGQLLLRSGHRDHHGRPGCQRPADPGVPRSLVDPVGDLAWSRRRVSGRTGRRRRWTGCSGRRWSGWRMPGGTRR